MRKKAQETVTIRIGKGVHSDVRIAAAVLGMGVAEFAETALLSAVQNAKRLDEWRNPSLNKKSK